MLYLESLGKTNNENYIIKNGSLIIREDDVLMITGILSLHFTIPSEKIKKYLNLVDELREDQDQLIRMSCGPYLRLKQKRGLIDIGGKVLQIVFGTATESQVHEMKEKINIQSKHLDEMHLYTNEILKKMITVKDAVLKHHKEQAKEHIKLWTIELCLSYHQMMTDAQIGTLDLNYFNKTQIEKEISKFSEKTGLIPISHPDDLSFRRSLKTMAIDQRHLSISILFTNGKEFKNFIIKGFPMFIQHQENYKIKLKTEISRILISKENKFYGKIDEKSILKGFRANNKTYNQPFPIELYTHATTCGVSLILGDPKNCKYKMAETEELRLE